MKTEKIVVLDPNGVRRAGKTLELGSEHEVSRGPHLDAWLRFGQVKLAKQKPEKKKDE